MKKRIFLGVLAFVSAFFFAINVHAARTDMIDISSHNNNGNTITTEQYASLRNNYGVKAVVVKLSEGTTYTWSKAAANVSNANAAGLYTNGYHYARYTTTSKATEEAQNAVAAAKNAGLGVGSVIVADVEADEQKALTKSQNDLDNMAFEAVVENAGYRFDLYTMESMVNSKMTIADGSGWIAKYPKNVTIDLFTNRNGWQFSSKMTFNGLYGYYDVSQLYTNYYTANQDRNAVISNSDTTDVSKVTKKTVTTTSSTSGTFKDGSYTITRQNGTFYPNQTLRIFKYPGSQATGKYYYKGEHVIYDGYVHVGNYIYVSYKTSTGYHHYIAVRYAPTRRALGTFK
ncbi:hypothetical protein LB941_06175 [Ligilactobacillus sp. WILCCON 0076]|uniref:Lysozyme n=1 Tax=Ligilactobacillus ubinensis TaxID=2876789 RepID=A0A9X2JLF4_9LACO|nr:GH25 family lysozyme [Ligilactobacillus ubinensis]MCP0886918.1 hypothetical protein [Ligilactobacillus ubinensis]